MFTLPKTKEKRITIYQKLIKRQRCTKHIEGICIDIGEICGGYSSAPWSGWKELIEYFPELKVYKKPSGGLFGTFNPIIRKKIMESLELRLSKKKDIHKGSQIFKKK